VLAPRLVAARWATPHVRAIGQSARSVLTSPPDSDHTGKVVPSGKARKGPPLAGHKDELGLITGRIKPHLDLKG
jgi:hypothetical protein